MKLHIGKNLSLPAEAVTQTFAILGRRGSGKSYTAMVVAEELLEMGQQVVVIDPLDVWWGLRSSADGKSDGYPITIFGGEHADVPLEARAGKLLADVIVEQCIPAILSLRHLNKTEFRTFVAEFAERIYELKGEKRYKSPLQLIIDEADAVVPQRLFPGTERCFGAVDTLVRRGRSSGVGTTLISQRAAVLSKDVLTQTEVMVAHQTTGPQDRKALEAWIEAHDTENRKKAFLESIAGLKCGVAWFWSPAWLDIFQRVDVRTKRTFDSSSTPKAGARAVTPKKLAPVDIERLKGRIAETIERKKADDPKELRKRIAELERELAKHGKGGPKIVEVPAPPKIVERPVFDRQGIDEIQTLCHTELANVDGMLNAARSAIARSLGEYRKRCADAAAMGEKSVSQLARSPAMRTSREARQNGSSNGSSELKAMHRAMLTALAQHPEGLTKRQILIHTSYASSGPVSTAFADLARLNYVDSRNNKLCITKHGLAELGPYEPLPVGDDLREWLLSGSKLSTMQKALLKSVCDAYPDPIQKKRILEEAGYASSGPVSSAFAKLVTYGYVTSEGVGTLRAAEELFS